ncbi:hypothetical protein OAV31_00055 [bacterium]|nr:hypothetical protein [bacterium]
MVGKIQRLEICQSGSFSEIADTTLQDISKSGLQLTINQRQFVKSVLKKIKTFHNPKVDPSTAIVAKAWKKYRKGMLSVRGADCLLKIKWRLTGDLQDHTV